MRRRVCSRVCSDSTIRNRKQCQKVNSHQHHINQRSCLNLVSVPKMRLKPKLQKVFLICVYTSIVKRVHVRMMSSKHRNATRAKNLFRQRKEVSGGNSKILLQPAKRALLLKKHPKVQAHGRRRTSSYHAS